VKVCQSDVKPAEVAAHVPADRRRLPRRQSNTLGERAVVAAVAAFEAMQPRGLADEELSAETDVDPRGDAPKQGDAQTYVEPSAASAARGTVSLGRRVHHASVLAVVAAVQLVWLSVLGYGLFSLLS
jgi:hypothetical protein